MNNEDLTLAGLFWWCVDDVYDQGPCHAWLSLSQMVQK